MCPSARNGGLHLHRTFVSSYEGVVLFDHESRDLSAVNEVHRVTRVRGHSPIVPVATGFAGDRFRSEPSIGGADAFSAGCGRQLERCRRQLLDDLGNEDVGVGKDAASVSLSSLSQVMSRFTLSLAMTSA